LARAENKVDDTRKRVELYKIRVPRSCSEEFERMKLKSLIWSLGTLNKSRAFPFLIFFPLSGNVWDGDIIEAFLSDALREQPDGVYVAEING